MRILTAFSTFALWAFAVALSSFVGLIFLGFSGIQFPLSGNLGRSSFFAVPLGLGCLAGILAVRLTAARLGR